MNGAISTLLAVLVLGSSQSYVFVTFFRQLFLCIVFGLAHGLVRGLLISSTRSTLTLLLLRGND
jgi:hypothetical protein